MRQQIFIVPKFWHWFFKFSIIFCGGMLIVSLLLPILEKDEGEPVISTISTMILGFITFGFSFFISIKTVKELPYSPLVIDDEGIWYQHLGKVGGLVPWSKITRVKERHILQHLELLDDDDNVLIKAEYQLEKFAQLRDIIIAKTNPNLHPLQQKVFVKDKEFHWYFIGYIFASMITAVALWLITPKLLFLLAILSSFVIWECLTTVIKVTVAENHFVLSFPLHKKIIPFTSVKNIATTNQNNQGNTFFQIGIFVEGKKRPYRLTRLGVDDRQLLIILRQVAGIKPYDNLTQ